MKTIVVGFDGSEAAERALARAADIAEAFTAGLVVLSSEVATTAALPLPTFEPAAPVLIPGGAAGPVPAVPLPETQTDVPAPEELARRHLERARMMLAKRGVEAEYVAEVGDAAERLLEVAEQRDADLIVVGSPEHGFLERLLSRPVGEALVRRADRDVLLVH